jgi:hypothetical protein
VHLKRFPGNELVLANTAEFIRHRMNWSGVERDSGRRLWSSISGPVSDCILKMHLKRDFANEGSLAFVTAGRSILLSISVGPAQPGG